MLVVPLQWFIFLRWFPLWEKKKLTLEKVLYLPPAFAAEFMAMSVEQKEEFSPYLPQYG